MAVALENDIWNIPSVKDVESVLVSLRETPDVNVGELNDIAKIFHIGLEGITEEKKINTLVDEANEKINQLIENTPEEEE